MNGRLSNSVLLRQIIPKVKATIDGPKQEEEVCSVRTILPVELIASELFSNATSLPIPELKPLEDPKQKESKITNELIDKLNKLKESSEFGNIVKGSKLGLTSYQKPKEGIPFTDLSKELLVFINNTTKFINKPSMEHLCYGLVLYNLLTKRINFYSPTDKNKQNVLGYIDVTKFPSGGKVDRALNISSYNAIANSTVTKNLQIIKDMIPDITVSNETLNIEKE